MSKNKCFIAIDVSKSMYKAGSKISGGALTALTASAAMAMILLRMYEEPIIMAFADRMYELPITKEMNLTNVQNMIEEVSLQLS